MENQRNLSDPIALRIPTDILARIERIAEVSERTRSWVIVRALKAYLASEGEEVLAVAQAREQMAKGGSPELEDVLDGLDDRQPKGTAA